MTTFQKIGVPNHAGLIKRPALLDSLKESLNYQMALVSAPPGCGKTSLAIQFAQQVESHVIWLGVTPYEQDLRSFLTTLIAQLMPIAPTAQTLRTLIQQQPEVVANELTVFLRNQLDQPLTIIIDDWHLFDADRNASSWLQTFINVMPTHCHLFIISRTIPDIDLITMTAKRQILAITQDRLYFDESDVYMLAVKLNSGNPLDDELIQAVWQSMQGWPAGTVLGLQPSQTRLMTQMRHDMPPSEAIFQSIARDMLEQQPPHIQKFLKWTAIPDTFSPAICEDVLGLDGWRESLAYVKKQNLFLLEESGAYRYQQLFRAFLLTHFKLTHPEQFTAAHRRMAIWYQTQNKSNRAFDHFIEARAIPQAIQLAESVAYSYFVQGRIQSLRHFYDALADQSLLMPHLHHVHAKVLNDYDGNPDGALISIELALDQFLVQHNINWYLQALQQKANILLQVGHYREAIAVCQQILDHERVLPIMRGNALSRIGTCHYLLGDLEQALFFLEDALILLEEHAGLHDRSIVIQDLELVYRDLGKIDLAQECLVQLVSLRRKLDNPENLALALNNLGFRYYEQGLYDQARATFNEGLEMVRILQSGRARYFLHASIGDLERDCGYFDLARSHYQTALNQVGHQEPHVKAGLLISLSKLYRWQQHAESSLTCAQDALQIARDYHLNEIQREASLAILQMRIQPGYLQEISNELAVSQTMIPTLDMLTLRLRLANYQKDHTTIHHILQAVKQRQERGQSVQPFLAEVVHNEALTMLMRGQATQFPTLVRAIDHLRAVVHGHSGQSIIIPMEAPTHHLYVFTLGNDTIRRDERYLQPSDWQSSIAREMFFYLIFNGNTSREKLISIFWEHKSPDQINNAFNQTISRMRGAIGIASVGFNAQDETYGIQPQIQVMCDAHQFENLIQEAQKLAPDSARGYDAWYQATQLYQGDFLPNLDRMWITLRRETYHKMATEAYIRLGEFMLAHRDDHNAIQSFERASALDPYSENACRGQMRGWAGMGESAKVQEVYNRLRDLLQHDLRIAPSDVTTLLLRQLLRDMSA